MHYVAYNDYEQRTAGMGNKPKTVQAWKTKTTQPNPQADILTSLEKAKRGEIGRFDKNFDTAMAMAPQQKAAATGTKEAFQFGDIVDIINPLQHLPIVNMVYREMTNDQLNPMAQVIGGALYGGPVGAITGTINAVTKVQTGRDMGDHMLEFAGLKTRRNVQDVVAAYARPDLDNMPSRDKIKTVTLNS